MPRLRPLGLASVLWTVSALPASAASLAYTAVDLGTLNGCTHTYANGINNSGQVTGYCYGETGGHGFVTGSNGVGMTDLGNLVGGNGGSYGSSINDAGQVTGYSWAGGDNTHAFITGPNGQGMTDLGTLGGIGRYGEQRSEGHAINNAGQVTGQTYTPVYSDMIGDVTTHAFITGPNGVGMIDIGTLGGGVLSYGFDINNTGQVTGTSYIEGISGYHAFVTGPNGVGMIDLGTPGTNSHGSGINDAGQVVGEFRLAGDYHLHAFITGPNGQGMTELGTLGGLDSTAIDINSIGQVVGGSRTNTLVDGVFDAFHAFVTGPNGVGMVDLNALVDLPGVTYLTYAQGINDKGQIIANGSDDHAYLISPWTVSDPDPIPEPETMVLVLTGLGLISFMTRRRKGR